MKIRTKEKLSQGERCFRSTATSSRHSARNCHCLLRQQGRVPCQGGKPRSVLPTALTAMSPAPCEPAASPARSPGHLCFYLLALQSAVATWKRGHLAVPPRAGASPALDTAPGDQQHRVQSQVNCFDKDQTVTVLDHGSALISSSCQTQWRFPRASLGSQCRRVLAEGSEPARPAHQAASHKGHSHQPVLAPDQGLRSHFQPFLSRRSFRKVSLIASWRAGPCGVLINPL